jgi:hypothetical protein
VTLTLQLDPLTIQTLERWAADQGRTLARQIEVELAGWAVQLARTYGTETDMHEGRLGLARDLSGIATIEEEATGTRPQTIWVSATGDVARRAEALGLGFVLGEPQDGRVLIPLEALLSECGL